MTNITIRKLTGQQMLDAKFDLGTYAFGPTPPLRNRDEWMETARGREDTTYIGALDGDRVLAGGSASPMTQNLRGKILPANGIWGVATDPAARRGGLIKRVMTEMLADQRAAGQALSTLYPFRESFYQRMGYTILSLHHTANFDPASLGPLLKQDLGGTVERVMLGEKYDEYREFLYMMQRRVHGMGVFDGYNKLAVAKSPFWLALARVGGETVGVMLYQIKGDEITRFKFEAYRFYYLTPQGRYLLLQWIARHIDQTTEATLTLPAYERPETWLADMQVKLGAHLLAPLGRVLDVARLGGIETGPGHFTARIVDPICPWNEGVWRFETVDGTLQVEQGREADCVLQIQAVSGLVYGTHDPADFAIRGWGDPTPELQATMRTMFPPRIPYLHEDF